MILLKTPLQNVFCFPLGRTPFQYDSLYSPSFFFCVDLVVFVPLFPLLFPFFRPLLLLMCRFSRSLFLFFAIRISITLFCFFHFFFFSIGLPGELCSRLLDPPLFPSASRFESRALRGRFLLKDMLQHNSHLVVSFPTIFPSRLPFRGLGFLSPLLLSMRHGPFPVGPRDPPSPSLFMSFPDLLDRVLLQPSK